jgi:carboxypeptidase Q
MFQFPMLLMLSLMLQVGTAALTAQPETATVAMKIRDEGNFHSKIMRTMHFLTDVYGPRLTGSPNYKAAADWTVGQMKDWGLVNAHLEPWDFGHPGWVNERFTAHILSPVKDQLTCEVVAWTPGTNGTVTGRVFPMILPEKPTAEDLARYLDSVKDKVKGSIVFAGRPQIVPVTITPPARRRADDDVRAQYDPKNPRAGFMGRPGGGPAAPPDPTRLTQNQINEKLDAFLVANGALIKVLDAGMPHSLIRAFSNRTYDVGKSVPAVVMRNEDYGRISRILSDGTPVELEFNIVNKSYPEGKTTYNVVAEIEGTDKKDEVVMLGGHLDSWHSATGATDNAIGCAVMMEAARILRACGIKPRRTIRVGLWSAEEQGLLGSQAYVKEHFGSFEDQKPEFSKLSAYLNIDSGTGRGRGMSVFGPPEAAAILREYLAQLEDLGLMGALAGSSRRLGGTDSTSFNQAGLPGIGISQDPIEYFTDTWHTSADTYERVIEDDAKASATAAAIVVWQLAMRDATIPRFSREKMPPAPKPEGETAAAPARP